MTLSFKETKRLFYNKWLYKVSLKINGAAVLRSKSGESLEEYLTELPFSFPASQYPSSIQHRAFSSKGTLIKLNSTLQNYDKKSFTKRFESDVVDLYTNNKNLVHEIQTEFEDYIRFVSKPKVKNIKRLLSNEKSIFVDALPKDKYAYKVYLKPYAVKSEKKHNFIDWLSNQGDSTTLTASLTEWFYKTTINWDRRYILVDNEQTLLMLRLHTPEAVGTVYKYEVVDK